MLEMTLLEPFGAFPKGFVMRSLKVIKHHSDLWDVEVGYGIFNRLLKYESEFYLFDLSLNLQTHVSVKWVSQQNNLLTFPDRTPIAA